MNYFYKESRSKRNICFFFEGGGGGGGWEASGGLEEVKNFIFNKFNKEIQNLFKKKNGGGEWGKGGGGV